jgi:tripartite-type tricarboxylate transporter receptor subunit TctC
MYGNRALISRAWAHCVAALFLFTLSAAGAVAQSFPAKVVRIIVPTAAGGSIDFVARTVGQELNRSWNQGVVVDNRAGAGGVIGVDAIAKSAPDGHTIGFVPQEFATSAGVNAKLPYDPLRDLAPVTLLAYSTWIVVVNPSIPARSMTELVALAKRRPGAINYASTGTGTGTHLAVELLKHLAGIDMLHIPYKGTVPALTDVVGGHVGLTVTGMAAGMPQVKAGRLRVLAVTGTNRSAALPELPTIGESVRGYEANNWLGVLAPRGMPPEVLAQLNGSIVHALQADTVKQGLLAQGIEPVGSSAEQFGVTIRTEIDKYTKLAKSIGVRVE